jgi:hypothetical protein
LEGAIESALLSTNDDGTYNKTYTFRPVKVDLLDPKGKSLKLKDNRKNSVKVRNTLWKTHFNEGYIEPFDDLYNYATLVICRMAPEILKEALKLYNEKE